MTYPRKEIIRYGNPSCFCLMSDAHNNRKEVVLEVDGTSSV